MKKVYYILLTLTIVACNNGKKSSAISEGQAERDSIAMALKADSIEREQLFEARGDTIFGTMRFGMDKIEAQKSANEFMESLKAKDGGFRFDSYFLRPIDNFKEFDELSVDDLKHYRFLNRLYKGKLYSVCWETFFDDGKDGEEIANRLSKFISYFEIKYGKCSENNLDLCKSFGEYFSQQRVYVHGIVAKWETSKRRIQIELDEIMDADMPTSHVGLYHYKIRVVFVDKEVERIVDGLIEEKINTDKNKRIEQQKQDSARLINSL